MAGDDACDDVGDVGLRVDAVEFAGFHERGDDGPVLGTAVRAGEECIFAIECDRPDGALNNVGVDLDAAVVEEAGEALPARECVAGMASASLLFWLTSASFAFNQGSSASTIARLLAWRMSRRSSADRPRISPSMR